MRRLLLILVLLGCGCASTETSQTQQGVKKEINTQNNQDAHEKRMDNLEKWQQKLQREMSQPNY